MTKPARHEMIDSVRPEHGPAPTPLGALPPDARRRFDEAGRALLERKPQACERLLAGVIERAPDCFEVRRMMGVALRMQGRHADAVEHLEPACRLQPRDGMAWMDLAIALYENGQAEAALEAAHKATGLVPGHAGLWFNRGRMLKLQGAMVDAGTCLSTALRHDPAHVGARVSLADICAGRGEAETAASHYRSVLARHPYHAQAWTGLANLKVLPLTPDDVVRLREASQRKELDVDTRIALGFALAKALEDQSDHPAAFDVLERANTLKRSTLRWDARREHERIDALVRASAAPLPTPLRPSLGSEIIFVVSLPRSGSSLVEQILASHPEVEGGGERLDLQQVLDAESARRGCPLHEWLPQADARDWDRLGEAYLHRTAALRGHKPRSTDKNLLNWQFVGAIVRMLPSAHIVHCVRDPLETCLAGYRQWFSRGNEFSYDLQDMVDYWSDHTKACAAWAAFYPGRMHELGHEALLAHMRDEVARMLAACGLGFDEACLRYQDNPRHVATASAVQVRQPLSASTARAALYGDRLDRLRGLLERAEASRA
jgi:tetratricopeptide (TPR) repeat protein